MTLDTAARQAAPKVTVETRLDPQWASPAVQPGPPERPLLKGPRGGDETTERKRAVPMARVSQPSPLWIPAAASSFKLEAPALAWPGQATGQATRHENLLT